MATIASHESLAAMGDLVSKLVEKQRSYFKAVKDFQDECTKNEMLMTKLSEVTGQQ